MLHLQGPNSSVIGPLCPAHLLKPLSPPRGPGMNARARSAPQDVPVRGCCALAVRVRSLSWGCCNKGPQTGWLKATHIYSLQVWKSKVQPGGVAGPCLLGGLQGSYRLFCILVGSGLLDPWPHHSVSALVFTLSSLFLCVSSLHVTFLQGHQELDLGTTDSTMSPL